MKKTFDAVKWVRDVRDKMYVETKRMSKEEKAIYHKKRVQRVIRTLRIKPKHRIEVNVVSRP